MTTSNYFQFPIRLLQHGKPIDQLTDAESSDRANDIVNYCLWDVGMKLLNGDADDRQKFREMADRLYGKYITDEEYERPDWDEEVIWVSSEILGVELGDPRHAEWHRKTHSKWQENRGGHQQARIRADIVWDLRTGKFAWRDFAVLVAVYTAIGSDYCTCITVDRINAMALGFNGIEECAKCGHDRFKLTAKQIRWTLDALYARGWFSRISPNRRHVFYSNKYTEAQLMDELVAREVKKARKAEAAKTEELRRHVLQQLKTIDPELDISQHR